MKPADSSSSEPLPPGLAELEQLAAGADAAIDGAGEQLPGAAPAPEVDKGEELGAMLELGFKMAGKVLPPLTKYFDHDACAEIGGAYIECAEKYGWTLHEKVGGPEVRLGVALAVPSFLAFMETKAWLEWRKQQMAKDAAGAAGERLESLPAIPAA